MLMNNFTILLLTIVTFLIACVQCSEPGDEAMLLLAGMICAPAFLISVAGICTGKNFFEC
jgi:hypothetical protein